jgi:hypothetical protein
MDNIIEPTMDFDFSKLYLASPSSLTGGAYFTRIFLNNKPLYIQTTKSLTKQGFIKSGKKMYTDLMFNNNDTILINWLENLESRCQELIHEKGSEWFESQLDKNDIETAFSPTMKLFKSGKFYLLRVNVKPNIKIYNEVDEVIDYENIKTETNIISILEIQGIKFTSRNFQIEIELKQSMIVSPDPFLDECFIKKPLTVKKKNNYLEETKEEIKELVESSNSSNKEANMAFLKNEINNNSIFNNTSMSIEEENENEDENNVNIDITNIEDLNKNDEKDNLFELTEVNFNSYNDDINDNLEPITLQKPNEVYYKIYKAAREKAKQAKKEAVIAYLEAKNIKKTYMLDDLDESDESDMDIENISENDLE